MPKKNIIEIVIDAEDKSSKVLGGVGKALTGLGTIAATAATAAAAATVAIGAGITKLAIDAAPLEGIEAAFRELAKGSEISADRMLDALKKGSAGMISQRDLMESYNLAAQLVGKTFADQLPDAMQYLGKVSAATGEDMGFLLDSLVRGVGRLSPMILDNLGIQIDLNEAYEAWAGQIGKTVEKLTKEEQQAAVMSMVMGQLAENTAAIPAITDLAATGMAKFGANIQNLKDAVGTAFLPVLSRLLEIFNELVEKYGPMIAEWAGQAGEKLAGLVEEIAGAIEGGWPAIRELLAEWAARFWDWVTGPGGVTESAGGMIQSVVSSISDALIQYWPVIAEKLGEWAARFWDWVSTDVVPAAMEKLAEVSEAIAKWAASPDTQSRLAEVGENAGRGLVEGIGTLVSAAATWTPVVTGLIAALGEAVITGIIPATYMMGQNLAMGFVGGVADALGINLTEETQKSLANWALMLTGPTGAGMAFAEMTSDVGESSAALADTVASDLERSSGDIGKYVDDSLANFGRMRDDLVGHSIIPFMMTQMQSIIESGLGQIVAVIASKAAEIGGIFTGLAADIVGILGDIDLFEIGAAIMESLRGGIMSKANDILSAITDTINEMIRKAREALGMLSPSIVFEDIGKSMMEGMALGISGSSHLPAMAAVGAAANVDRSVTYHITQNVYSRASTDVTLQGFESLRALYG